MVCKLPNAKHFSLSARKTILIQSRTVIVMHCRWSVCQNWWSSMYFSKYECWVLERFREQAEIKYSWLYLPKGNEKTQNWNDVILELARCLGNNKLHILLTHVQPGRIKLISNKYRSIVASQQNDKKIHDYSFNLFLFSLWSSTYL